MAAIAKKTDPRLWNKVKEEVQVGDKGGAAGEWSARKAQLAVQQHKKLGGGYAGGRDRQNHLAEWGEEDRERDRASRAERRTNAICPSAPGMP